MALSIDGTIQGLKRTSNVVSETDDFTALFWWKPSTITSGYNTPFYYGDNPLTEYANFVVLYLANDSGYKLFYEIWLNSVRVEQAFTSVNYNRWIPIAYTRSGNTQNFYYNGILIASFTVDLSTTTNPFSNIWLGNDGFSTADNTQQFLGYREYDRALSLTELITEWNSAAAVSSTDIVADCPLVNDPDDDSGNGNDFIEVGSVNYVDGPLQVPTDNTGNTGGTNAYDIGSLPSPGSKVSFVQVVRVGATTPSSWFKYTPAAIPANVVFGMYWLGSDYAGTQKYLPTLNVYTGTPPVTDFYKTIINFAKRPMEVPVDSVQTYFIRMVANSGNPAPAVLYIEFYNAPNPVTSPAGSILINDAVSGFPAGIFDPSNMDLQQFRAPFAGGDDGYKLANGYIALEDRTDVTVKIYDNNLNYVATVPHYSDKLISGNKTDNFYIGELISGNRVITVIDQTGADVTSINLGPLSELNQMTPNQIADTLYIVTTRLNGSILKYSASTGSPTGTFASGVSGFHTGELFWLNGNTLLAVYISDTAGTNSFIRRYDCNTGAILNTYNLPNSGDPVGLSRRLAVHLADPFPNFNPQLTFHVWYKIDSVSSRFQEIQISDGTVLSETDREEFFAGQYQGDFENPNEEFGYSASCSFYTLVNEVPPLTPGETGTIRVVKNVVGGGGPSFDFVGTGTGIDPTFSLSDTDEIEFTGLDPNSGYGIEETPVAGYTTTYHVSNGSPRNNISVGPGETVTVTVTNAPAGSIQVTKITAGILTTLKFLFELNGNGITTSTAQLANGESFTFENIPAAAGYTLSETQLAPGWQITNVIINGSAGELSNITVAGGVTTVVVVTNTFTPTEGSGIYFIEPGKLNDTLWRANNDTKIVKIPDPNFQTALLGE